MYDTSGSHSVCYAAPPDNDLARRLTWLRGELARQEAAPKDPSADDGWRALRSVTLGDGLTTAEAYAWFGTFLGLFPPFAIFTNVLAARYPVRPGDTDAFLFWGVLFLLMNAVCCLVGSHLGHYVGRRFIGEGRRTLPSLVFRSLLAAVVWGVVTGAAGGAVGFLLGAFFGIVCAVPVALAAFPVFAVLHRALSRDGMIEDRRLWPLAFGVPLTAAATVLGPLLK